MDEERDLIQLYNHYRKHWLARFYQDRQIIVIPTIAWSDEKSFDWCFDGEPRNSIVAVSTIGVLKNKEAKQAFFTGYEEMNKVLSPTKIICFTNKENCDTIGKDNNIMYINVSTFKHKPQKEL